MATSVISPGRLGVVRLARVEVPRAAFVAAWTIVVAEAAVLAGLGGDWQVGVVVVSPLVLACPLGLAIACMALRGGGQALHRDIARNPSLWVPLAAGLAGVVVAWAVGQPRLSGWDAFGLVTAATLEETVFRLALPVCVWQVLRTLGRPRAALGVAAAVAVATFAVMPGHLAQMSSPAEVVPFVCLALFLLGVVWIGRDPLLAVAAHLGVNAWTLAATFGVVAPTVGRIGTAAVIVPVGVALTRRTR